MSYRKNRSNASYNQRRFRDVWSQGLPLALAKAVEMENDGWKVDTSRTLMAAQAKEIMNELSANGFESEAIPIATWEGEEVVLLAAKPKSLSASASPSHSKITGDDEAVAFKSLWKSEDDNGFVMSLDSTVAFIKNNASPTDVFGKDLQKKTKDRQDRLDVVEIQKETLSDLDRYRAKAQALSFLGGKLKVDINQFRRALNMFPSVPLSLYVSPKEPLVIKDPEGNALVIAPWNEEPNVPVESVGFEKIRMKRGVRS